jgi:hypothetical protein
MKTLYSTPGFTDRGCLGNSEAIRAAEKAGIKVIRRFQKIRLSPYAKSIGAIVVVHAPNMSLLVN